MSRRTERLNSLIRQVIGELMLSKLSDPRIDPARTAVTRVEVPEDLLTAKVYVSVMGSESEQRTTIRALRHAAGHIQELMRRQVRLRHTPVLRFEPDEQYKKTLETLAKIDEAMKDVRRRQPHDADDEPPQGGRDG
ncbi:MAG: 30S ribosome-binding factor RbfA [Phycisphaerae bacterium]|nr:30S ribosome-binding factor RbfA [Phycisphaerae bacterium]